MGQQQLGINSQVVGSTAYVANQVGKQRELWVGQRHGDAYAAAYAGALAFGANQTGATTSAGLATTYTGLCLSNPAGSGKNLAIMQVSGAFNVVDAASVMSVGLIAGYSAAGVVTHTTALTVYNSIIGSAATGFIGLVDSACTLVGTPIWVHMFTTALASTDPSFSANMLGSILIPPGGYIAIGTTVASGTASLFGKIAWEEVPV